MASFSQSIGKWATQTEERIEAVHKTALEGLAREMTRTKAEGGAVPFLTGNLYRSLTASTSSMPRTIDGQSFGSNANAVIATIKPNQYIYFGYQAKYARRMNYGFIGADSMGRVYNQQGNYFVEEAIQMWPDIVRKSVEKVKNAKR